MRSSFLATGLVVGALFFCACNSTPVTITNNQNNNPSDGDGDAPPGRVPPGEACGGTGQACAAHDDCCGGFFCNDGGTCEAVDGARGDFSTYFSGTTRLMNAPAPGSDVNCTCNDEGDFVCESSSGTIRVTLIGNVLGFYFPSATGGDASEPLPVVIDANGNFTFSTSSPAWDASCGTSTVSMTGTLNRNATPRTITVQVESGDACCVSTGTVTMTDVGANPIVNVGGSVDSNVNAKNLFQKGS